MIDYSIAETMKIGLEIIETHKLHPIKIRINDFFFIEEFF